MDNKRKYYMACLSEECGEIIQILGKIFRFGEFDQHPKTNNIPNIELLKSEANDLLAVLDELGIKRNEEIIIKKKKKLEKYWKYSQKEK